MVADPAEKDAAHTRQSGVSSPCTHVRLRADQLESSLEFFAQRGGSLRAMLVPPLPRVVHLSRGPAREANR